MTPEARGLADRLDRGDLPQSTLEILAGLGHAPAAEALERETEPEPFYRLVGRFTDSDPLVRAVLASARAVLPLYPNAEHVRAGIAAFETWLADPTPRNKRARDQALGPTPESNSHCGVHEKGSADPYDVATAVQGVYFSRYAAGRLKDMRSQARSSIDAAIRAAGQDKIYEAIRSALIPELLGPTSP